MLSRRYVVFAIAALLLASSVLTAETGAADAGAAEKKIPKKAPKVAPRPPAIALDARVVFARVLTAGYSTNRRFSLLRIPKVQEDLKLDKKQIEAIEKTFKELTAKRREIYAPIPGLTPQERSKIIIAASQELVKYTTEQHKKLLAGLKAEQSKRLDQIVVQTQGMRSLDDPKIAKALAITDEQKKGMAAARVSITQDRRKLYVEMRGGKIDRTKLREKLQELAKANDRKVLDVLSKKQQEQFEKMQGKKIELGSNTAIRGAAIVVPIGPGGVRRIRIDGAKIRIEVKPAPKKP
ncbi:MAG: hypothetical protein IIA67_11525 [Planctomycetes bacterium]|nr:hypothetical protein [Planctomycetota bacterium]